jgi:hypothetical protein
MEMTSSHGSEVIAISDRCSTIVIGRKPLCLAGRLEPLRQAGARHLRADFLYRCYAPEQVRDLWRRLREGRRVEGHVANFDRGFV